MERNLRLKRSKREDSELRSGERSDGMVDSATPKPVRNEFSNNRQQDYTTAVSRSVLMPGAINTEKRRALSARLCKRCPDAIALNTVTSLCRPPATAAAVAYTIQCVSKNRTATNNVTFTN